MGGKEGEKEKKMIWEGKMGEKKRGEERKEEDRRRKR